MRGMVDLFRNKKCRKKTLRLLFFQFCTRFSFPEMLAILQSQGGAKVLPPCIRPCVCTFYINYLDNCDYNWIRRYCSENMDGQNCCFLLLCLCYFILCSAGCKYICSLLAISFFAPPAVSIFDG